MSVRDEVLNRIRAVRPTARVVVPRDYAVDDAVDDRVDLFVERVADYRATVRRCTPSTVPEAVAGLLVGVPRIVAPYGVPREWFTSYPGVVGADDGLSVADLDAPGLAVVTGCAVAIATTGTIVLDAGPDQGRRALTLVPDHHVCVVRAEQIVAGVPAALRRIADPTRALTFISGPSATSDIELNRVEGVHGPRRLDVVVVEG
jgi:L-lactate dehydrogenase complex protein LldG